ncbi:hypothetical protein HGRIS_005598 [Hohenbuehelia grisea]|uniref:Transmembrane protein n=1 Tax=Hohenbuehelia grisea TaxID=104357 RepID=A0ABR3JYF1_9AGAR
MMAHRCLVTTGCFLYEANVIVNSCRSTIHWPWRSPSPVISDLLANTMHALSARNGTVDCSRVLFDIDDTSPLIKYTPSGAWTHMNQSSDSFAGPYHAGTLTQATGRGASAYFTFNGTSIKIHGGARSFYGSFNVTLDGQSYTRNSWAETNSSGPGVLFDVSSLSQGMHTLNVSQVGDGMFDIDKISWTTSIFPSKNGETQLEEVVYDDTDSAFSWTPDGTWDRQLSKFPTFRNQTGQLLGETVSLFGTVGHSNAPYKVQLDGSGPQLFDGGSDIYNEHVMLFFADNLGPGNHTLVVTNAQNDRSGLKLEIDYAKTKRWPVTLSSATNSPSDPMPTSLKPAIVIGTVIAGIVVVFLICAVFLLFRRNRSMHAKLQSGYMVQSHLNMPHSPHSSITETLVPYIYSSLVSPPPESREKKSHSRFGSEQSLTAGDALFHMLSVRAQAGSRASSSSSEDLRPIALQQRPPKRTPKAKAERGEEPSDSTMIDAAVERRCMRGDRDDGDSEAAPLVRRREEWSEALTWAEDFVHVPVAGDMEPPAYWQATASYFARR